MTGAVISTSTSVMQLSVSKTPMLNNSERWKHPSLRSGFKSPGYLRGGNELASIASSNGRTWAYKSHASTYIVTSGGYQLN